MQMYIVKAVIKSNETIARDSSKPNFDSMSELCRYPQKDLDRNENCELNIVTKNM